MSKRMKMSATNQLIFHTSLHQWTDFLQKKKIWKMLEELHPADALNLHRGNGPAFI